MTAEFLERVMAAFAEFEGGYRGKTLKQIKEEYGL